MASDGKVWPKYTWQEVAEHNTEKSAWAYCDNDVLDVTPWINEHPGGRRKILMFAGRDLTHVLPTYHPLIYDAKMAHILRPLKVGELSGPPEFPRFQKDDAAHYDFRQGMIAFWKARGRPLSCREPGGGLVRVEASFYINLAVQAVIYLTLWLTSLYAPESALSMPLRYVISFLGGMFSMNVLVPAFHEGSHLGDEFWWIGRALHDGWFASNFTSFVHEHVVGHHTHTNFVGVDPNAPGLSGPDWFLRLAEFQPLLDVHRWQWLYMPASMIFLMSHEAMADYALRHYSGRRSSVRVNPPFLGWRNALFEACCVAGKLARVLALPWYLGVSWWCIAVSYIGFEMGFSLWGTCVFLVSHFFEETFFPEFEVDADGAEHVAMPYSEVMYKVSLDYGGYWHMFMCAGVSCHTVHHLVPGASQCSQLELQPLVRAIAEKHGYDYNYKPTLLHAIVSFMKILYNRGRDLNEVEDKTT